MRIIAIGTDENILVKNSRTYLRVREYSNLVEEYFCLVFTTNKKFRLIEDRNFKVIPIYGRNKFMQVRNLLGIFDDAFSRLKKKESREMVLSSQDAFEIGLLSYYLAEKYNFKLQVQMHTDISTGHFRNESLRNFLQYQVSKFVLRQAHSIRVVSGKMEKFLQKKLGIKKSKIHLLPIYTDTSNFKFIARPPGVPRGQLTPGGLQILMMCRIEEVKNIPLGISAVSAFRKISGQDHKLKIVGKGGLKERFLETFKNRKWIEWADWTEDVEKEYHQADMLLVTSNYEGWGLTAVESVACGTPVAISPVGVANEFIMDEVNGFVAKGHDVINIMEAICKTANYEFDPEIMQASLQTLDTKEVFLEKMRKLLN